MRLSLILLIAFHLNGLAQIDPYSVDYNVESGLPTSNFYSVYEDSSGFIWFSSDVGVIKFDGYDFVHYSIDEGLADNEIFEIFEDSQRRIWFLSLNGKLSFYHDETISNGSDFEWLEALSHQQILVDIIEDDTGTLFFAFKDGHINTLDVHLKVGSFNVNRPSINALWKHEETLHVLTNKSILNYTSQDETYFTNEMLSRAVNRSFLYQNVLFFSSKNSLFSSENGELSEVLNLPTEEIISITISDDIFWLGSREGVFMNDGVKIRHFFKQDAVSGILKDSQGNHWFTTLNDGIKFIPNLDVFRIRPSLSNSKVSALNVSLKNELWVAAMNDVFIKKNNLLSAKEVDDRKGNRNSRINRIRNFGGINYVVGTELAVYNETFYNSYYITANDILHKEGFYYLATSTSAFKFDEADFKALKNYSVFTRFKVLNTNSILKRRSNVLAPSKEGIFIGTNTGLFEYGKNKISLADSINESLQTSILDLHYNEDLDQLIVASNSKGILLLEHGKLFKQIGKTDGLSSNRCNVIQPLSANTYLIGTNKGLNKIVLYKDSISVLDYSEKLDIKYESVNDIAVLNDTIYTATNTGIIGFPVDISIEQKPRPKLIIDEVLVNGKNRQELMNLEYGDNDLSIKYTGISFKDYGNLSYEYKLDKDIEWYQANNRQIDFKNLPYGKYNVALRVRDADDVYSKEGVVSFKINPPFWKTVPFIFFSVFLFFAATLLSIRYRLKKLRNKFDLERKQMKSDQEKTLLEKQMIELEQKALRMQMNPHFIFNALNTIKGYYSGGEIKEANFYINKFSKLLRLILESDEYIIPLNQEVEMLELYIGLIQLRYPNVFTYQIKVGEDINTNEIGIPPLLLQPMVENAVIHGLAPVAKSGRLEITFTKEGESLVCKVKDDGVGYGKSISKKSNHESKAMKITNERIRFMNNSDNPLNFNIGQLTANSGTIVTIKIPISHVC